MNEKKIGIYRIKLKTKPVQDGKMQQQDVFKYCRDKNIIGLGWEIPDQFKSKTLKIEDAIQTREGAGKKNSFKADMITLSKIHKNDIIWVRTEDGIYYIGKIIDDTYKCWDMYDKEGAEKYDIRNIKGCKFYKVGGIEKAPGVIINSFSGPGSTLRRIGTEYNENLQMKIRVICKMIFNEVCDNDSEKFQIEKEEVLDFWTIIDDQEAEEIVALYLQFVENYKVYITTKRRDTPKYEFIMVNSEGEKAAVQVKTGNNVTLKVRDFQDDKDYEKIFLFSVNEDKSEFENSTNKVKVLDKEEIEKFLVNNNKLLLSAIRNKMKLCGLIK